MARLARIVRNQCFDLLRRRGRELPLDAVVQRWADLTALSRDARRLKTCPGEHDGGLVTSWVRRGLIQLRDCIER